jgi:hypothetical protein
MATDGEFLAFVNHVIGETNRIVIKAGTGQSDEARTLAALLCEAAGKKKRELLGLPEPDPDVDYDPDCHWDGTPLLPGETRREKGESFAERLDLATLTPETDLKIYRFSRPSDKKLTARILARNEGTAKGIFRMCATQGRIVRPFSDSDGQQEVLYFDVSALPSNEEILIEKE